MGGCQNYGPFWILIIVRHLIFRVPTQWPIILTTTQMVCWFKVVGHALAWHLEDTKWLYGHWDWVMNFLGASLPQAEICQFVSDIDTFCWWDKALHDPA